jgi:hypothetical protein
MGGCVCQGFQGQWIWLNGLQSQQREVGACCISAVYPTLHSCASLGVWAGQKMSVVKRCIGEGFGNGVDHGMSTKAGSG